MTFDKEEWHVLPVDDIQPHEESLDCHCMPTITQGYESIVVTHNAFDGREILEQNPIHLN